jgi:hypothetical protein
MGKFYLSAWVLAVVLALSFTSACGYADQENEDTGGSTISIERVTEVWVASTVDAYVLNEMFARDEDGSVMENIRSYYEERRELEEAENLPPFDGLHILLESGVISDVGGEYRVALNMDDWNVGGASGVSESEVREAMRQALEVNEVDWCGEPRKGHEFADSYVDAYWGAFDTREEYVASIEEYVTCGSGS